VHSLRLPESLLMILDDSKGYTTIPFVPHTMIFALKTAQTYTESGKMIIK